MNNVSVKTINEAAKRLDEVIKNTPLEYSKRLSKKYGANVYLKREDLQEVRSYKIRGAYNLMSILTQVEKKQGVVCASAGNHAQGVAFSAAKLHIHATIFIPSITPLQKIDKVKQFGGKWVNIKLVGHTYDEASTAAKEFCTANKAIFVDPFDNPNIISGQGTVGKEIYEGLEAVDFIVCPIGGGGLISGVSTYFKEKKPSTIVIGAEPEGAAGMYESLKKGRVITLENIDTFVDGAAVKTVGHYTFEIVSKNVKTIVKVPEGKVCTTLIELYQSDGIVAEPAGALSISALDELADIIRGKTLVCILSGGNNDILRYPEIMEKSLVYQGRKHYFLINFAQKPGQLRQFLDYILGPTDDIVRFEYMKKNFKETGPALIGLELAKKENLEPLLARMIKYEIEYTHITTSDILYRYLI